MGVQERILRALVAPVLGILVGFSLVTGIWFYTDAELRDRQQAETALEESLRFLEVELFSLYSEVRDYARWDDAYEFVKGTNPQFTQNNFTPDSLGNTQISLVVIQDPQERLLFSATFSPQSGVQNNAALAQQLLAQVRNAWNTRDGQAVFATEVGWLLVAQTPITRSDGSGEAAGAMFMARPLKQGWFDRLAEVGRTVPVIVSLDQDLPQSRLNQVFMQLQTLERPISQVLSWNEVAAYALLRNASGQPQALVELRLDRVFSQVSLGFTTLVVLLLFAVVVTAGTALWYLLRSNVLSPLQNLEALLVGLSRNPNPLQRLPVMHTDEIGRISQSVNLLLQRLELDQDLRQQAQAQLLQSENRFREVSEGALDAILIVDDSGTILLANPAFVALVGLESGQATGKPLSDWVGPNSRGAYDRALVSLHQGQAVYGLELTLVSNTSQRQVLGNLSPRPDGGYYASLRDVTQQNLAQQTVQQLIQGATSAVGDAFFPTLVHNLQSALDCQGVAIYHLEQNTPVLLAKSGLVSSLGPWALWGTQLGQGPGVVLLGEHMGVGLLDRQQALVGALLAAHVPSESRGETGQGVLQVFGARAAAELEHQSIQQQLSALNQDLEQRVQQRSAQVHLQASAMEATLEGIALLRDGRLVYVNPAFAHMFGYAPQELQGQDWSMLSPPEDLAVLQKSIGESLRLQGYWSGEVIAVRKDGSRLEIEIRLAQEATGALIWTCVDISERKQVEQALRQSRDSMALANRELAKANRLKDEFLAGMSHELRTPLNAVLGLTELMQNQVIGPLNEKQLYYLANIEKSSRHLLSLINDILDLAKIEAEKLSLYPQTLPARQTVQEALELVQAQAQQKNLQVFNDTPDFWVTADPIRLKQILVNLLSNAVKFTPTGGSIGLKVEAKDDGVAFTVWDTGVGISAQDQKDLFSPFVQGSSGLSREYSGSGLGLSLVRRLTELHHGRVEVQSQPGQGSRFTVWLPQQPHLEASAPAPVGQGPTLLLVDDDEQNLLPTRDYLQSVGYQVAVARSGYAALQMLDDLPVALVVMDIQMPGMDGLETTRRIRALPQYSQLPIIAVTALAMPGDQERCLQAGANAYMAKPIRLAELGAAVNSFVQPNQTTP